MELVEDASKAGRVIGREKELAAVDRFLAASVEPALVLSGDPGVGKSTLFEACVQGARDRGFHLLVARASEPEVRLSFVVLADLLAHVDLPRMDMPAPVRRALEVAVLRAEPDGTPPEPFAVATGLLAVLRDRSEVAPTLVALDDVSWLDPASADALCFAAHRARGGVRFLLARRPGRTTELERVLAAFGVQRLELDGLSRGAIRLLLAERLALVLPRRVLVRLHEVAQGNPLFALELGRALLDRGIPEIGAELPLPDRIEDLFVERVSGLSPSLRRALLAVSLSGPVPTADLVPFLEPADLHEAVQDGLLVVDDDRVRTSHPLIAATVRHLAGPDERRAVHRALARADGRLPEPVRLRHLALAADAPDGELGRALATGAAAAAARGAAHDAVELAGHASRLTPADAVEWDERVISLAHYLAVAGEISRLGPLLEETLDRLGPVARVRAHLLLAEAEVAMEDHERRLDVALAESGDDPALRSLALAAKAFFCATIAVARLVEGEAWAAEAVRAARDVGPEVEQRARYALAATRLLRGRPFDDLVRELDSTADIYSGSLDLLVAVRLGFRGHVSEARRILSGLLELADAQGEGRSYAVVLQQLCRIEVQAGNIAAAAELLEEADGWGAIFGPQGAVWRAWLGAYLTSVRGERTDAERHALDAVELAAASGTRGDQLDAQVGCGLASLLRGDAAGAAVSLRVVWEHMQREGVDDPGVFPVAGDLVEALVQLHELDEARAVVARLELLSVEQEHPWGLASTARCVGLVESEPESLTQAALAYDALGLRFDAARSLLARGRVERRLKRWRAARGTLEQAAAAFERIGAGGWADEARSELARVGGRRARASGELTPAEERIADLAAAGLSNKEIAARLVVSVYTVERHLTHAYAKLGVRSRTQLARRLGRSSV